jgi:hypothetical protein
MLMTSNCFAHGISHDCQAVRVLLISWNYLRSYWQVTGSPTKPIFYNNKEKKAGNTRPKDGTGWTADREGNDKLAGSQATAKRGRALRGVVGTASMAEKT